MTTPNPRWPLFRWNRFPRASRYDPAWILAHSMGPHVLWLTEALCEAVPLEPGMRVLDMGCGRALSSIFLAREFGVTVWANDLWVGATDNWERVRQAGLEDRIFPIRAEARQLPYAEEFFDAIFSVDSYHYYGTDELYLKYFVRFLKPGGRLGFIVPGLTREIGDQVPAHLTRVQPSGAAFWDPAECFSFRTHRWWRRHLARTGLVQVERADMLSEGWRLWLRWEEARRGGGVLNFPSDANALRADRGRTLGFARVVAKRPESPRRTTSAPAGRPVSAPRLSTSRATRASRRTSRR